jgi:predicted ribosomally synthesized peptide with nif11-like leader
MTQPKIKQLKAEDLSAEELRLQKVQQVIDDLLMAANSDETLKEQLDAATSSESLVKIAARHGYELTVADLEMLRRRTQQQAQLHSDEFDDDELSEQELELVAGGRSGLLSELMASAKPGGQPSSVPNNVPNKPKPNPPWW